VENRSEYRDSSTVTHLEREDSEQKGVGRGEVRSRGVGSGLEESLMSYNLLKGGGGIRNVFSSKSKSVAKSKKVKRIPGTK